MYNSKKGTMTGYCPKHQRYKPCDQCAYRFEELATRAVWVGTLVLMGWALVGILLF